MKFKIKKLLYIVLCACFLLNIESMFVYAANDTVPQRVAEIASGSNNIYGVGIPIEHIANPNQRFVSGGLDHTHQYIVAQALMVLNNDCGASIFNQSDHAETLLYNADWPDNLVTKQMQALFRDIFMILIRVRIGWDNLHQQLEQEQNIIIDKRCMIII